MLRTSLFAVILSLVSFLLPTQAMAVVTGHTANMVEFSNGSQKIGAFRQKSPTTWVEEKYAPNQKKLNFVEVARDDWSIYLHDASRKVDLQLDLHTKKVMYRSPSRPNAVPIYTISKALNKVNGYLATGVTFTDGNGKALGEYTQTSATTWKESGFAPGARTFQFVERNRDEWSVYLYDAGRKVHIQLDLHTRKVMYSDPRSPRRAQYKISGTTAKVNGHLAKKVTFAGGNGKALGNFRQTSGKNWVEEKLAAGQRKFNFVEVGRDDWSVYLLDRSRNVEIQLDMHTQKVMYAPVGKKKYAIYGIVAVNK